MAAFNYEWYTVDVLESAGRVTWEVKAKSRDHAIARVSKMVDAQNEAAADTSRPWWERGSRVDRVYWDTLTLDRVGYERLY